MKTLSKIFFSIALLSFVFHNSYAQTNTKKKTVSHTKSKTTAVAKKASPVVPGKEVTVTLKNLSEGTIAIFAGPKDELKNLTMKKTVGGLSKNTLYVRVNEVVCILNGEKTVSCAAIHANTTLLEINSSGNGVVAK